MRPPAVLGATRSLANLAELTRAASCSNCNCPPAFVGGILQIYLRQASRDSGSENRVVVARPGTVVGTPDDSTSTRNRNGAPGRRSPPGAQAITGFGADGRK